MAPQQRTTKAGQATYRAKDGTAAVTISWGAGYPPIDPAAYLGGRDLADFERHGDDPQADLEDVPESP